MKLMATALSVCTTMGISTYWILVFTRIFPVTDLVLSYRNQSMSFLHADGWISVISLLVFIFPLQIREKATHFGLLTSSSLVFPGLCALL